MSRFSHLVKFIAASFANPFQNGAFFPTSDYLSLAMIKPFDIKSTDLVVEIGAGTGAITEHLVKKLNDPKQYLGFELNQTFIPIMEKKYPQLNIIHDNALNIKSHLGGKKANFIVSSLPWTMFSAPKQIEILNVLYENLENQGEFCTYAYAPNLLTPTGIHFKKTLKDVFGNVKLSSPVWMSAPPAFVYFTKKDVGEKPKI